MTGSGWPRAQLKRWRSTGCGWTCAGGCQHGSCRTLGSTADEFCGSVETEDDASAKRQRLMAGMPVLHETDVDVNVDAHRMVVLAVMPDDQEQWTLRVIDWDRKYHGAKSGTLLDTQKVCEGRLRELANIEKLEVAEPIPLQEARAQNLEIVYGKWLDDAKGQIGCNTGQHVRPRGCDAGDTTNQGVQNHCESNCNEKNAKGQHDCLIGRHDMRVAIFHAKGSGRVVILPPKDCGTEHERRASVGAVRSLTH